MKPSRFPELKLNYSNLTVIIAVIISMLRGFLATQRAQYQKYSQLLYLHGPHAQTKIFEKKLHLY